MRDTKEKQAGQSQPVAADETGHKGHRLEHEQQSGVHDALTHMTVRIGGDGWEEPPPPIRHAQEGHAPDNVISLGEAVERLLRKL